MTANQSSLADGNILSNIDNIGPDELKERLVVAEMIMKKLYARNKELETGMKKQKENFIKTQQSFHPGTDDDDSDVDIGCSECPKLKDRESQLIKQLEEKAQVISSLEEQVTKKVEIDVDEYLKTRLEQTQQEANRHFENYIQVRDMYNDLLTQICEKKKNRRLKTDSEFLRLKESLKQHTIMH